MQEERAVWHRKPRRHRPKLMPTGLSLNHDFAGLGRCHMVRPNRNMPSWVLFCFDCLAVSVLRFKAMVAGKFMAVKKAGTSCRPVLLFARRIWGGVSLQKWSEFPEKWGQPNENQVFCLVPVLRRQIPLDFSLGQKQAERERDSDFGCEVGAGDCPKGPIAP